MTLSEFKAWMEGFREAFPADGCPTAGQFAKIMAKLATVTGDTIVFTPRPDFMLGAIADIPPRVVGIDWSAEHLLGVKSAGRQAATG